MLKTVSYEFVKGSWRAEAVYEKSNGEVTWKEVVHPARVYHKPQFTSVDVFCREELP